MAERGGPPPPKDRNARYRLLAHTADLRAELEAPDAQALRQSAVDLVRTLLVGDSPVSGSHARRIAVEGDTEAERFFRFLRELLFLYDVEAFLPAAVEGQGPLMVRGESFDPARHASEHQLKALTRHGYAFERTPAGYRVEVIFDL
jgi:SHS2 domain-containing protein